jgi:hypothetical protein
VIDRGNDQEWPHELRQHLAQFRQGSVVAAPPLAYYSNTNHPIWIASRDSDEPCGEELIELGGTAQSPFGMIVTQDCDIEGDGAQKKPWVQIVPVYQLPAEDNRLPDVHRWAVRHFAPVTAFGPVWVADLRIESATEKSWLRAQTHQSGFATIEDYIRFSAHARAYRGRPGMSDAVYHDILLPLHDYVLSLRASHRELYDEFADKIAEAYGDPYDDPLNPATFRVVLVTTEPFSDQLTALLDQWWESIGELNYDVLPIWYLTLDSHTTFRERQTWIGLDPARLYSS